MGHLESVRPTQRVQLRVREGTPVRRIGGNAPNDGFGFGLEDERGAGNLVNSPQDVRDPELTTSWVRARVVKFAHDDTIDSSACTALSMRR